MVVEKSAPEPQLAGPVESTGTPELQDEPLPTADLPDETIPMVEIEKEAKAIADLYAEADLDPVDEEEGPFAEDGPRPNVEVAPKAKAVLLTVDEARAKIAPETLEMLKEKFNGSILGTRHLDDRDSLF